MEEGDRQGAEYKPQRWDYEKHFREYLLLLARKGKHGLESLRSFPGKIELSPTWHETLNAMREATADGVERWALVGFREDMRTLVLPTVFPRGERGSILQGVKANIPEDVMRREIQRAREKAQVKGIVGDIHSHPRYLHERLAKRLFGSTRIVGGGGGFSAGDLYSMIIPEGYLPMMAVVEPDEYFFAFRTRDSRDIPTSPEVSSQQAFEKYWYEKSSVRLVAGFRVVVSPKYSTVELNYGIARRHNLVLYRGKPDEDLERIYPRTEPWEVAGNPLPQ
ncbi:MAG: hypothetical protein M1305_02595 [Candidatus Marsarchaeota archaeon]|nr:hypothetical protein [Candidatus Marsarchaeota archaeon]